MKRETLSWLLKGTRDGDVRLTREDCADALATDAENKRLRKELARIASCACMSPVWCQNSETTDGSLCFVCVARAALKRKR